MKEYRYFSKEALSEAFIYKYPGIKSGHSLVRSFWKIYTFSSKPVIFMPKASIRKERARKKERKSKT